ncbi:uncharacterized protein JCM6883_002766, partial [Sporobolomyces salmoneus]|uniref:uncharacterized protein n=1 Tax=Sporobolomyces salmoneus TaxID=183962 RepID=UPI00316B5A7F
ADDQTAALSLSPSSTNFLTLSLTPHTLSSNSSFFAMAPISIPAVRDTTVAAPPSNAEKNPGIPYYSGCIIARKDVAVENINFEKNPGIPYYSGCTIA